jgi:hypothetical protein
VTHKKCGSDLRARWGSPTEVLESGESNVRYQSVLQAIRWLTPESVVVGIDVRDWGSDGARFRRSTATVVDPVCRECGAFS